MTISRRQALRLAAALPLVPLAASQAAAQTTHVVTIENMAFSPASLAIKAGDTVQFVNRDRVQHSAMDLGGAWDTGLLGQGQATSLTFGGAGTFNYRCRPHANMRGSITIS